MGVVRDRGDSLGEVALGADNVGVAGLDGLSLQVDVDTLLLGLALLDGVLLNTVDELLTRAGVRNVLDADVDALLEVAVADTLVDDDTNGGLGNVVHDTGLTVVDLVGHTVKILSQNVLRKFVDRSIDGFKMPIQFGGREYFTDPFWTAPLTLMSTMSPTLSNYQIL